MTKSKIFLILSLSFISGIFLASFFKPDALLIYLLAITSVTVLSLGYKNKKAWVFSGAVLFFTFGLWQTAQKLKITDNLPFEQKEFSGEAIVAKEPAQKENYQQITAEISLGSEASKSRILINAGKYAEINYGDKLSVRCLLQIPENKDGDFDYRMYLAKDKIYYICQSAKIEKTGENSGNKFYSAILNLKNKMAGNISRTIPYPQSALANGLIFGGSSELPERLKNNFSKTGMTHIVAVSGYNVSIIAEYLILFGIFIGLWRKQAFWFAVTGIILFVVMIGLPSSAVRAGVMGTLLIWAAKNGRLANSWNAIIFSGAVMLLINPLIARWDIGFQLSFLATIGIVALSPLWEKYLIKRHKAFGFTEIFFLTLSAQIFVLPVILYDFRTLSLVSLAANILILLIIPISMLLVFLCALAGLFFHWLALPFAWLAFLPLKYETWTIDSLAGLSRSSVEIKNFLWWHAAAWYAALALLMYHINRRQKIKMAKRTGSLANKENYFYAE
jgi:competence protein ComEC